MKLFYCFWHFSNHLFFIYFSLFVVCVFFSFYILICTSVVYALRHYFIIYWSLLRAKLSKHLSNIFYSSFFGSRLSIISLIFWINSWIVGLFLGSNSIKSFKNSYFSMVNLKKTPGKCPFCIDWRVRKAFGYNWSTNSSHGCSPVNPKHTTSARAHKSEASLVFLSCYSGAAYSKVAIF